MAGSSKPLEKRQASLTSFFTQKTVNGLSRSLPDPEEQSSSGAGSNDRGSSSARKRPLEADTDNGNTGPDRSIKRSKADGPSAERSTFFSKSPSKAIEAVRPTASASGRTERYLHDESRPSANVVDGDEDEDEVNVRKRKEELHRKFVKKLGHPDSLKRRWQVEAEPAAGEEEEGDGGEDAEEEDSPRPAKTTKKKGSKTGKLTPMEIQFLDIKRKHMDTILIVEVGYKFRFFGEDARIAAKELSIVCIPGKFRYDERKFHQSAM